MKKEYYLEGIVLVFLIILSTFLVFNNLGKSDLHEWDESVYAENALEMFKSGDFIVSTYMGSPDLNGGKFPLGYWMMVLSYHLFGINEFSVRFVSAIFGVSTIILVYFFGKSISGKTAGLISSLILLITPNFIGYDVPGLWPHASRTGDFDIILTFFVVLTFYLFYLSESKKDKKLLILTGLTAGLGVMAKTILGLIPLFVIVLYFLIIRKPRKLISKEFIYSWLLMLLVILPWSILRYIKGKDFFINLFLYHTLKRSLEPIEGHYGSYLYYINYIKESFGIILFVLLLISTGYMLFLVLKKKTKINLILLLWIAVYIFIFTIVKTKLFWYIFPTFPTISLLVGKSINDFRKYLKMNSIIFMLILMLITTPSLINSFNYSNIIYTNPGYKSLIELKPQIENFKEIYVCGSNYGGDLKSTSLVFYLNLFNNTYLKFCKDIQEIPKGGIFIFNGLDKKNEVDKMEGFSYINGKDYFFIYRKDI